jgi:hypothetical protein
MGDFKHGSMEDDPNFRMWIAEGRFEGIRSVRVAGDK